MKRKKFPLPIAIFLGIMLACSCIGCMFLMTASIADPDLYKELTDPVKAYTQEKLEDFSWFVVETQEKLSQTAEETGQYLVEKVEESREEFVQYLESLKPEEPDTQALGDAMLHSLRDIADYSTTHLEVDEETGYEIITGGTHRLYYFNQTDDQWGDYGRDSIYGYGCGPTSMAMVVSTLTDRFVTPQEMADIFVEQQFWCHGSGTYYNFAYGSGELFGLNVETLSAETTDANMLLQQLFSGKIAIALVKEGHFTSGGHFIVLRGSTLTGDILVADPASRERSLTTWDPQVILDELSLVRSSGAPLWLFSPEIQEEEYLFSDDLEVENW